MCACVIRQCVGMFPVYIVTGLSLYVSIPLMAFIAVTYTALVTPIICYETFYSLFNCNLRVGYHYSLTTH